jgi:predicted metal-dependent HD superfamily phosphohydrolase
MAFDLIRLNINEGIISNVRCLILSEINKSRSIESKIFHDIDYSVLGKDKETYLQYSKYIKFENEFFPDYNEKRMSLLQSLLKKRRIYLHDYFYDKYEKQARINIANEIESLNKK